METGAGCDHRVSRHGLSLCLVQRQSTSHSSPFVSHVPAIKICCSCLRAHSRNFEHSTGANRIAAALGQACATTRHVRRHLPIHVAAQLARGCPETRRGRRQFVVTPNASSACGTRRIIRQFSASRAALAINRFKTATLVVPLRPGRRG